MRRLLVIASTMILFDVAFYSAIAPLLPDYVDELGLSKAEAGILSAAYAAGTLLASLPAGLLASRAGPRRTVLAGLALLGLSSVVFGFGHDDRAARRRPLQPGSRRRADLVGRAHLADHDGAARAPRLGDRHRAGHRRRRRPDRPRPRARWPPKIGTEAVFGAVLAICRRVRRARLAHARVGAAGAADARPRSRPRSPPGRCSMATAFVAVPSLMFGAIEVLVPLRIDDLGGGHALIAGGFIVGAGIEAALAPISGRYSDRVGRRSPFVDRARRSPPSGCSGSAPPRVSGSSSPGC